MSLQRLRGICRVRLFCSWPRHVAQAQRRTSLLSRTITAFMLCLRACLYALATEGPCVAQEVRVRTPAWFKQLLADRSIDSPEAKSLAARCSACSSCKSGRRLYMHTAFTYNAEPAWTIQTCPFSAGETSPPTSTPLLPLAMQARLSATQYANAWDWFVLRLVRRGTRVLRQGQPVLFMPGRAGRDKLTSRQNIKASFSEQPERCDSACLLF
jgi:hypothetical protein